MSAVSNNFANPDILRRLSPDPFPFLKPVTPYATKDYMEVLRKADTRGQQEMFAYSPNGRVSEGELKEYKANLTQQLQYFGFLDKTYGNIYGDIFKRYGARLGKEMKITNILIDNFFRFSDPNLGGPGYDQYYAPRVITPLKVKAVAGTDGNPLDITDRDVRGHWRFPDSFLKEEQLRHHQELTDGTLADLDLDLDTQSPTARALRANGFGTV
jgi:hypothetical protein